MVSTVPDTPTTIYSGMLLILWYSLAGSFPPLSSTFPPPLVLLYSYSSPSLHFSPSFFPTSPTYPPPHLLFVFILLFTPPPIFYPCLHSFNSLSSPVHPSPSIIYSKVGGGAHPHFADHCTKSASAAAAKWGIVRQNVLLELKIP